MSFRAGFVVLAGLPNVGKSTLMNRLVGNKLSIVSPKPQTTRSNILAVADGKDYQAVFLDTPGILTPEYELQKSMLASVRKATREDADVLCLITEPRPPLEKESALFGPCLARSRDAGGTVILVINKMDMLGEKSPGPSIAEDSYSKLLGRLNRSFRISALNGEGVGDLRSYIIESLPEHPPYYPPGQWTDRCERFYVAELIREQIFNLYSQEIPYFTAVEIETFSEGLGQKDSILAVLHVDRSSQKPILIGKGGRNIKILREKSQVEIEKLTGRKVRLELWVKVTRDWRNDPRFVKMLTANI